MSVCGGLYSCGAWELYPIAIAYGFGIVALHASMYGVSAKTPGGLVKHAGLALVTGPVVGGMLAAVLRHQGGFGFAPFNPAHSFFMAVAAAVLIFTIAAVIAKQATPDACSEHKAFQGIAIMALATPFVVLGAMALAGLIGDQWLRVLSLDSLLGASQRMHAAGGAAGAIAAMTLVAVPASRGLARATRGAAPAMGFVLAWFGACTAILAASVALKGPTAFFY